MKKIIITGAAGLVGLNLLNSINCEKYNVIAIDKNKNNLRLAKKINPKIQTVCADLSVLDKFWGRYFENGFCVIQLQAQISDSEKIPYIKNNIKSVENIIKTCEENKIKNLIHISSSVVMSIAKDYYTNTKKIGEYLVKKSKIPHTILRPPLMYGCFDIKHLNFIVKKFEKSPIIIFPGKGDYIRQPLYVKNFIKILLKLIEKKPKNKIYSIIGKEQIYFIDLIKEIYKQNKQNKIFIKVPIPIFVFLLKIHNFFTNRKAFVVDQLKALTAGDIFAVDNWEKEFGIKYTSYKQGVKEMINSKNYILTNFMQK
ncbi:MAG: NAD(P)-dependent oxidoreductase [Nanoarchaeota archaeon]|nr:NAD(P)-dependent oxidoreductase [Nanoarchaeota archaeon]MBU1028047.1 NAD(P)-dependent oxidoreductase [Nanoarchaeota archaeon]